MSGIVGFCGDLATCGVQMLNFVRVEVSPYPQPPILPPPSPPPPLPPPPHFPHSQKETIFRDSIYKCFWGPGIDKG